MFIDRITINVKSGKGGDGAVSFRREKYVPNGGPDGGDGGKGGSIILESDSSLNSLSQFRYKRAFTALGGDNGSKNNRSGKDAGDLVIKLPVGTVVFDGSTGEMLADFTEHGQQKVACRGGRGGKGNARFANSRRQSPKFAKPGDDPEERQLLLELKIIADVGLIGFPNAGKSTLLAAVTNAKPKIADYRFTTLTPNLGVASYKNSEEFVIADIPGLIEGASAGAGLGLEFLRHIERTRLLLHLVDLSSYEGPVMDRFHAINAELASYSQTIAERPMAVCLTKTDLISDSAYISDLESSFAEMGYECFAISSATGSGIPELLGYIAKTLPTIPKQLPLLGQSDLIIHRVDTSDEYSVEFEDGIWRLEGEMPRRLLMTVNLDDYESSQYFQRVLKNKGVFDYLEELGIQDGDTLEIMGYQFDYYK
ncbi:MAG: GTPase ObgE [Eubacteriaceae bacterium]|nr:GTPase ObgE [Eubacteriaceae bacterium]